MNKAGWLIGLFAAMVLAQWLVPVNMIMGTNRILEKGTPMKFRCAPIDPNDPFRGKFIALQFDISRFDTDSGKGFESGQEIYLSFKKDSLGYDNIDGIFAKPPAFEKKYLKTTINYIYTNEGIDHITFNLPFTRFYLEETKAPVAEELYRTGISDTTGNTYGWVYLLDGEARIKDVIIRDTSIIERLRRLNQ